MQFWENDQDIFDEAFIIPIDANQKVWAVTQKIEEAYSGLKKLDWRVS